jgi:hypothetical protein
MIVDPNSAVGSQIEYVLCDEGSVELHDGSRTPREALSEPESAFRRFCRSLDPNRTFIVALVLGDSDREVFYEARTIADQDGLHMQAPLDTPEHHRAIWAQYQATRRAPPTEDAPDAG